MSTVDTQVLPAGTWRVDKVHSSIGFAVDYMAGTFHGTFSDFDAAVTDGVLTGSATVASVQVKDDNLAMTVELNPVEWGRLGVDVLATYLKGDKVDPRVFIKHQLIDSANVDSKLPKS